MATKNGRKVLRVAARADVYVCLRNCDGHFAPELFVPKNKRLLDKHAFSTVFDGQPVKAGVSSEQHLLFHPYTLSHGSVSLLPKKMFDAPIREIGVKRVVREYFRLNPLPEPTDLYSLLGMALQTNLMLSCG